MPYYSATYFVLPVRTGFSTAFAHEISVGDFNGDGKADIALSYFLYPLDNRPVPIRILLGDGLGGFTDGTEGLFSGGAPGTVHGRENVVADFNRDGRADLFVADQGLDAAPHPGSPNVLVLSSGAAGLINATNRLPTSPDFTHSAEAADVDRDGDLDLFVGNEGVGIGAYLLMNDGAGNFTQDFSRLPTVISSPDGAVRTAFTTETFLDLDGDGDLDMFLGAARQHSVHMVMLNDGMGRFTQIATAPAIPSAFITGSDAVDAQAIDLNGDGRQDLLVTYSIGAEVPVRRYVQALISRGDGTFVDETTARLPAGIQGGEWSKRSILADFNGDGHTDLLLSNGLVAPLFLNDGRGVFVQMPADALFNQYDQYQAGDLNGDGRMDLFVVRGTFSGNENFSVYLATAPATNQTGTASAEGLMSGSANSTIMAGGGNDVLFGGAGQDFLRGEDGDDYIVGGAAFDDTHGNMGNDTVYGGAGDDWVVGGKDQDQLFGDEGSDVVLGNLGNDTCYGGDGDRDVVRGGQGNDVVYGGAGNDYVSGDRGDDTVYGGAGADVFHGSQDAGIDRVIDFSIAEGDRVMLDPGTTYTVDQSGADVLINMGGGHYMVLVGVQLSALPTGWIFESFVF